MRQIPLLLSFLLVSGMVAAQGNPPGAGGGTPPLDRDPHRREQIRDVLKPGRTGGASPQLPSGNAVLVAQPPAYQLTPQGRAELREQLRREQNDNRQVRP